MSMRQSEQSQRFEPPSTKYHSEHTLRHEQRHGPFPQHRLNYTATTCARHMSIIATYNDAWENGDVEALAEILHDEFVFNPHVGGITMSKSDVLGFAGSTATTSENDRILFENDEVGMAHSIVHFANGSNSEAVLSFIRFKDGKIILMETGATPLTDDYKLIGS